MIIDVKKYLFIGVREDIERFFKRAQEKGFIEFISSKGKRTLDYPERVQKMLSALKILRKQPHVKEAELTKDLDPDRLADTVVESAAWIEKLEEEIRLLRAEISRIAPFGDFSFEEIRALELETGRRMQFFCVKKARLKDMEIDPELIPVGSEYDMEYFISFDHKTSGFPGMIEMHFDRSLSQLQTALAMAEEKMERCSAELKENAAYIEFLREHLLAALNDYHFTTAIDESAPQLNDALFAVEGWIPKNRLHGLFPLLEGLGIHAEEVAVEEGERVPTYMENKNYGRIGEDLVHIYDTPATDDKDPSTWVFWVFSIFFAIIISDAGYGVIFLTAALLMRFKFKRIKSSGRRFLRLFTVISVFCIAWGVLSGSYFGLELSPKNPLNKLSMIHALAVQKGNYVLAHPEEETYREIMHKFPHLSNVTDGETLLVEGKAEKDGFTQYVVYNDFRDEIFMEIALLIGVIHISLSLLRYMKQRWPAIGWVLAIMGGYLFFPKTLDATSIIHFMGICPKAAAFQIGQQLFWSGIALAIFLALIQNKWSGLVELSKPIELFADILSYLRLYALGLAAMILAETFNDIGLRLGFAAGFFVILIGHMINITVGIMGGTIHGLRLNFIEWYHHSFQGGGRLFNPLKLLKK